MFERFTAEARSVLTRANTIAKDLHHGFIGTEHLLLGLEGSSAGELLVRLGTTPEELRAAVVRIVGPGEQPQAGRQTFTPRAKKVLERALREALSRDAREIQPEHLLLGILSDADGVGCQVLGEAGLDYSTVTAAVGGVPPGGRRWRRPFAGSRVGAAVSTPGGGAVPLTAQRLAGNEPVSTVHYLRALLGAGAAGRILDALGVTPQAVAEKYEELGVAGTSDEVSVKLEVEVTPEQAEKIRRYLEGGPPPLP